MCINMMMYRFSCEGKFQTEEIHFLWDFLSNQSLFLNLFHAARAIMARSSTTIVNQPITIQKQFLQTSFTFATTVKLDRSNYLLWHKQVLSSVIGSQLEGFISETLIISDQYLSNSTIDGSIEKVEYSACQLVSTRSDSSWLIILSTINEGTLTVLSYDILLLISKDLLKNNLEFNLRLRWWNFNMKQTF